MNTMMQYRPFKSHAWFVPFTWIVSMLAFTGAGFFLPVFGLTTFLFLVTGVICCFLTKILYDSSNITVSIETEGIRIVGGTYSNYQYVSWEKFICAYYARSYKGHLYLVLSPEELAPKQVMQYINKGACLSKLSVGLVVVIHIDVMQNTLQVREFIRNKVLKVNELL